MTISELQLIHDALADAATEIERTARALGDALGKTNGYDAVAVLTPLQACDLAVQRCTHGCEALKRLAVLDLVVERALGCRLQAMQLKLADRDFAAASTALAAALPPAAEIAAACAALQRAGARVETVVAGLLRLASAAAPRPEDDARLRTAVVERLDPHYTMAGERAVLAQFLAGSDELPDRTPAATEMVEEFFL